MSLMRLWQERSRLNKFITIENDDMKSTLIKIAALSFIAAAIVSPKEGLSQTVVKIGEAEIAIQSPISIRKRDTLNHNCTYVINDHGKRQGKSFPGYYEEFFIGMGMAMPIDKNKNLPVYYGNSYSLEVGLRHIYRASGFYAIGTTFQYTFYNYKLKGAAQNKTFVDNVPGEVRREYFRTDNLGVGLFNRFYLSSIKDHSLMLDLGGYADYSYSKRYKVKTIEDGSNEKHKYRDGSMFNPVQAGLYGAISKNSCSFFVRYRLTNLFNPDKVPSELPRFSIGLQLVVD